ncbi:MAG: hypothetical protein ACOYL6_04220 [Bacteriovoracaceae bacterium]
MRPLSFVLSLSFLTTFGWTLHSSLNSIVKKDVIVFSSLEKNMNVLKSIAATNWSMPTSKTVDYIHTEERLLALEKTFSKIEKHKSDRKVIEIALAKKPFQKRAIGFISAPKKLKSIELETTKLELNKEPIVAINIEVKEVLDDQFDFAPHNEDVSESYALRRYHLPSEFIYLAISEKIDLAVQDEIKLAQAAPVKESKKQFIPELTDKELQNTESDESVLKSFDQKAETKENSLSTQSEIIKTSVANSAENNTATMEDDLNTYEYSSDSDKSPNAKQPSIAVVPTPGVSLNVNQVIQREMQNSTGPGKGPYKFEKLPVVDSGSAIAYAQTTSTSAYSRSSKDEYSSSQSSDAQKMAKTNDESKTSAQLNVNTHLKLRGLSFSLKKGIQGNVKDFDYQSAYDSNDLRGSIEGEVKLDFTLGQSHSGIKSFSIKSDDHIKTNLNIELNRDEELEMDVPLLDALALEKFLLKGNREAEGGMLLVKVSPEIEKISIDKAYAFHASLDENMKAIKAENEAHYVLYVGVAPGNVLVTVKNKESSFSYVSNVILNELTYDHLPFAKKDVVRIELFSEELMGKKSNVLNVAGDELVSFSTGKNSNKLTLNTYEFNQEYLKSDSQNYFELKSGKMDLFFGVKNEPRVSLPSQSYQDEILRLLDVKNTDESCLIQVNLNSKKSVDSIRHQAFTVDGVESYSLMALDKDGSLGEDVNDTSTKLFFKGDHQGSLALEITYTDKTEESLQSFCSPGVYLVEQR